MFASRGRSARSPPEWLVAHYCTPECDRGASRNSGPRGLGTRRRASVACDPNLWGSGGGRDTGGCGALLAGGIDTARRSAICAARASGQCAMPSLVASGTGCVADPFPPLSRSRPKPQSRRRAILRVGRTWRNVSKQVGSHRVSQSSTQGFTESTLSASAPDMRGHVLAWRAAAFSMISVKLCGELCENL
jgi:hypothetical protein